MEYKGIYFCEEEDDEYDKGMGESGQREAKGTKMLLQRVGVTCSDF